METKACCGRASADGCRCHTDAAALADAVRAFGARRVRRAHDAEDVMQDALLRLYRSASTLRDEQALEAWMYRIADSAVVDQLPALGPAAGAGQPRRRRPARPGRYRADQRADEELAAWLTPLLARIPDDYRAALELTDLGGLTQEAAAAQLGLSTSGMKSRVQRGRRMLQTEVGRCCRIELDVRGAIADASLRDGDAC